MRRKNIPGKLQSVGEILFPFFKKKGVSYKLEEKELLKLWPKCVGSKISLQTKPDAFKNGILFIKTTSSVWVQQLYFVKNEIIDKLNKNFGKAIIKDIRFSVGYNCTQNIVKELSETKSFLKERDKKMIADCTSSLDDREMASILRQAMKAEINRRRRIESQQVHGK